MTRRLLLLLTLLSFNSFGQPADLPPFKPYFGAVIVQDIDKAVAWYGKTLGYEVINRIDLPKRNIRQANLQREGALLELIQTGKTLHPKTLLANQPKKTKIGGFFKLGFQVTDPLSGKRTVLILDPDGNRIQLFEQ
jgi:catechol 2,3-dioxygenase-like lactoylglutathione lyase family enzyme